MQCSCYGLPPLLLGWCFPSTSLSHSVGLSLALTATAYPRAVPHLSYWEALCYLLPKFSFPSLSLISIWILLVHKTWNKNTLRKLVKLEAGKFFFFWARMSPLRSTWPLSLVFWSKREICPVDQNHLKEPAYYLEVQIFKITFICRGCCFCLKSSLRARDGKKGKCYWERRSTAPPQENLGDLIFLQQGCGILTFTAGQHYCKTGVESDPSFSKCPFLFHRQMWVCPVSLQLTQHDRSCRPESHPVVIFSGGSEAFQFDSVCVFASLAASKCVGVSIPFHT